MPDKNRIYLANTVTQMLTYVSIGIDFFKDPGNILNDAMDAFMVEEDSLVTAPYQKTVDAAITDPKKVQKLDKTLGTLYTTMAQDLGQTDPATQGYEHAMRSIYSMAFFMALNGGDLKYQKSENGFFDSLLGRIPDFIAPSRFTKKAPQLDPDKLMEELKEPDRELSGLDEMNVLFQKFPLGKLLDTLSLGSSFMFDALTNHDKMSEKELEETRLQLLGLSRQAKELADSLFDMSREDMKAFSKIFNRPNRTTAVETQWYGPRGMKSTVSKDMAALEKAMEKHVPFSHLDVYQHIVTHSNNLEKGFDLPGAKDLPGIEDLKEKNHRLQELLKKDFASFTPEQAAEHLNLIGEASRNVTDALKVTSEGLPKINTMSSEELASLPENEVALYNQSLMLKRFFGFTNICDSKFPDSYIYGKMTGNTRVAVPGGLPAAPPVKPEQEKQPEVKPQVNNEQPSGVKPQVRNEQPSGIKPEVKPPVRNEQPSGVNAGIQEASVKRRSDEESVIAAMSEKMEILSSLYQHLYMEGSSLGRDSTEYKNFRNAIKAIHDVWNPPERRQLDLGTPEGRTQANGLFDTALKTANLYYLKHALRDNIKSSYGNVRRNTAIATIDVLASHMMKGYLKDSTEKGNMARDGEVYREQVSLEDLILNEKAYATLTYGNKNSNAYKKQADIARRGYQYHENERAEQQHRQARKIGTEEAVDAFLQRKPRR